MEIDKKIILKLIQTLEELKKSIKGQNLNVSDETQEILEDVVPSDNVVVKSPIVGTAYLAPEPGAKTFVTEGKKIKKGETIMIVEAMKTMNHIPSPSEGVVKKICVEDGAPVEFGQKLVILE
tara:strand:+ start:39 stop:404 length:366 start_codon:yes stop_codon:yes gene_type:complete